MEEGKGEEGPGCEGVAERERYVDVVAKKGFCSTVLLHQHYYYYYYYY
jgi:hypothetical protein